MRRTAAVLLADVAELRLAYFGQAEPRQPPVWSEVWNQPSPPLLVRVQLVFRTGMPGAGQT